MDKLLSVLIFNFCLALPAVANDSPQALQNAFMTALNGNNAQGLADCYSEDAVNFPVGAMLGRGPDSVLESWNGFFSENKVVSARLSNTHMEIHGDTAIAWGLFAIMAEPVAGGDAVEISGRYMDVARYSDGTWLYVADHASIPLPAPGVTTEEE